MTENSSYVNLDEFEKFVRNRFKNIVGGLGFVVPRLAVKMALDYIFDPEYIQPFIQTDTDCKKNDLSDEFDFSHANTCTCFVCRKKKKEEK